MSMSLDGFVGSDREHPGMAVAEGEELKQWKLDRISKAGAHLLGRVTYQEMSPYALAAADLIDEYRLLVQPLVLGRGQALFDQLPESRHLDLVETTPFPSGIVVHVYRPHHT
jgi:dihydrofolate reductase